MKKEGNNINNKIIESIKKNIDNNNSNGLKKELQELSDTLENPLNLIKNISVHDNSNKKKQKKEIILDEKLNKNNNNYNNLNNPISITNKIINSKLNLNNNSEPEKLYSSQANNDDKKKLFYNHFKKNLPLKFSA